MATTPSHLGLCVRDLDAALTFYCDGLGFEVAEGYDLDDTMLPGLAEALEVPSPAALRSQMIRLDGLRIELLAFREPTPVGDAVTTRHHVGFTHLSLHVDDLDAAVDRAVAHGGTLLDDTRRNLGIDLVFLADPDGARVELMARP